MLDRRLRRYIRNGTLTQLAAFEAVVQLGSFTRAADALHMAQPTVSLLVKKLSETLGVQLLITTTRGIRLTAAGEEAYKFCQDLFQSCAGLDERLLAWRLSSAEVLRIALCTGAESTVPAMLCRYCEQYPDTRLSLSVANRAHLLDRLAMGRTISIFSVCRPTTQRYACTPCVPTSFTSTHRSNTPMRADGK